MQNRWQSFHAGKLIVAILAMFYSAYYLQNTNEWHIIDAFNLIIHEAGHTFLFFTSELIHASAGTIFQIMCPIIFIIYFYTKRDYFSSSILVFWLGQNIINVSIYASDAMRMQLPLLGGNTTGHDWNYILNTLGILQYADKVGYYLYGIGILTMIIASSLSIINSQRDRASNSLI
ncbi:MAG TPA: hypothetical protein VI775_01585 [Candidatus Paceibacterota bacterium]